MATPFMRVDLSPNARDFESVAVEPGVPFLDPSNAHYRILRKWLGRFVAEPERDTTRGNDSWFFYVCDEQSGRLQNVRCDPATADDLKRVPDLQRDYEQIVQRLQEVKNPERREAVLYQATLQHLERVGAESGPVQKGCYFYRYRAGRKWHLVWAWGFQRRDLVPAAPTLCTNPNCSLLFVRTSSSSRHCPDCSASQTASKSTGGTPYGLLVAAVALLIGLGALLGYFWGQDRTVSAPPPTADVEELIIVPAEWSGPMGATISYQALLRQPDGEEQDVTSQTQALAEDPSILRVNATGIRAVARSPGRTPVHFHFRDLVAHATAEVTLPKTPLQLMIEPEELELGLGTTAVLRVSGEYEDGRSPVDLTEVVEWHLPSGAGVYCDQGVIEGISEGETQVTARYRASSADAYVESTARVQVRADEYVDFEVSLSPSTLAPGQPGQIAARVTTAEGEQHSVLHSGMLELAVVPPQLATWEGGYLQPVAVGRGRLEARYGDWHAAQDFTIDEVRVPASFEVRPKDLRLAVGETVELQAIGPSQAPVHVVSSNPRIVEVADGLRVVGRLPGQAELTVNQEARKAQVVVEVVAADLVSIAFSPEHIEVPVQGTREFRVMGRKQDGTLIDLAAEEISWEQLPGSQFAELDESRLRVSGRRPTGTEPERLVARWGSHRAEALLTVVSRPFTLHLAAEGPAEIPVGQRTRLRAWADYGRGRHETLSPDRVQWRTEPEEMEGLAFTASPTAVQASLPGHGPLSVTASYEGVRSNPVAFRSVDMRNVQLGLEPPRQLVLSGTRGQFHAVAGEAEEIDLSGVRFRSSDGEVLEVDARTGVFLAGQAGRAEVLVEVPDQEHIQPFQREIRVVDSSDARLQLEPSHIVMTVGTRVPLEVRLVAGDWEQPLCWVEDREELRLAVGRREAVAWRAPYLSGVALAEPFEVGVRYGELIGRSVAEVGVAAEASALRVVPSSASLAVGQSLRPRVQRGLEDAPESWQEVEPGAIRWQVPEGAAWSPAKAGIPPQLSLLDSAEGRLTWVASHDGLDAELTIDVSDLPVPEGPLLIQREPVGESLPVGGAQRYSAVVQGDEELLSAAAVEWSPAFENDYVRWAPPVLTARQAGHSERLWAQVGERRQYFSTRTVAPLTQPESLFPSADPPEEVRLVFDEQVPVTLPVRAEFDRYRVQAHFPDRPPLDVTERAILRVAGEPGELSPLVVSAGRLLAQRAGEVEVRAEYNGVISRNALPIRVVDSAEVREIELQPSALELVVGEGADLRAFGFVGQGEQRRSIGDITQTPGWNWTTDQPEILRVEGPRVEALQAGVARIFGERGDVRGTARATVRAVGEEQLAELRPDQLRLRVGETRWLGSDIRLVRAGVDLSHELDLVVSDSSRVAYDSETRSLQGLSPGTTELILNAGSEIYKLPVHVEAFALEDLQGSLVIEPSSGLLAVGESRGLRVIVVTDQGERLDQTNRALIHSDSPAVLQTRGVGRVVGLSPGTATVSARVPGIDSPGQARFEVEGEEFTRLSVSPSFLQMVVGQQQAVQVVAWGPGGRRELSHHPDLEWLIEGEDPESVALVEGPGVRAALPGQATLRARWRDLTSRDAQVRVTDEAYHTLQLRPQNATLMVGRTLDYEVYARQGTTVRPLTGEEGVELRVADPSVAEPLGGLRVRAVGAGTTEVTVRLGSQQAATRLRVAPQTRGRCSLARRAPGLAFLPDVLRLQLGHPGETVRILRTLSCGESEDVDHLVELEFLDSGQDIVQVQQTASGPVFVPRQLGETNVRARLDELATRRPLTIEVFQPTVPARLIVRPDPVRLARGQETEFHRVQIVPGEGAPPFDIDYHVASQNPSIVTVERGRVLQGVAAGQAQVRIVPVDVDDAYRDLSARVNVTVADGGVAGEPRLRLTGPTRTTVGASVAYQVEWWDAEGRQDVTQRGAELVGPQSEAAERVRWEPGCRVVALAPGVVPIRARYQDQISNPLQLQIEPRAVEYAGLELELERGRMTVGEQRFYRVWGHPADGGAREDLTELVVPEADARESGQPWVEYRVSEGAEGEVVAHQAPLFLGAGPGRFEAYARLGSDLQSEAIAVEVMAEEVVGTGGELRVRPEGITVQVDQAISLPQAMFRPSPTQPFRPVQVEWSSQDEQVLAPVQAAERGFVGAAVGQTQLRATHQGTEAAVEVTVVGNPFHRVTLDQEHVDWDIDRNRFAVYVHVESRGVPEGEMEYRVVFPGEAASEQPWQRLPVGSGGRLQLTSPHMQQGPRGTSYNLEVEARPLGEAVVNRYPLSFLITGPRIEERRHSP